GADVVADDQVALDRGDARGAVQLQRAAVDIRRACVRVGRSAAEHEHAAAGQGNPIARSGDDAREGHRAVVGEVNRGVRLEGEVVGENRAAQGEVEIDGAAEVDRVAGDHVAAAVDVDLGDVEPGPEVVVVGVPGRDRGEDEPGARGGGHAADPVVAL